MEGPHFENNTQEQAPVVKGTNMWSSIFKHPSRLVGAAVMSAAALGAMAPQEAEAQNMPIYSVQVGGPQANQGSSNVLRGLATSAVLAVASPVAARMGVGAVIQKNPDGSMRVAQVNIETPPLPVLKQAQWNPGAMEMVTSHGYTVDPSAPLRVIDPKGNQAISLQSNGRVNNVAIVEAVPGSNSINILYTYTTPTGKVPGTGPTRIIHKEKINVFFNANGTLSTSSQTIQ
jgi:hypothetical protein